MASSGPLKVGVLLFLEGTQFLDVAPLDLLGMLDPSWLRSGGFLPEELIAKAPQLEYHFINETGKGPAQMTAGFGLNVTDSIETCPPLDILLIGGPPLSYTPSDAMKSFLRTQHGHVSAFLTVCTGFLAPLHAGLLKDTHATAPRLLLEGLKKDFPDVKWEDKRWTHDGKTWTSGAILNGLEMMSEFMKDKWGAEEGGLVNTVLAIGDVPKRGQVY